MSITEKIKQLKNEIYQEILLQLFKNNGYIELIPSIIVGKNSEGNNITISAIEYTAEADDDECIIGYFSEDGIDEPEYTFNDLSIEKQSNILHAIPISLEVNKSINDTYPPGWDDKKLSDAFFKKNELKKNPSEFLILDNEEIKDCLGDGIDEETYFWAHNYLSILLNNIQLKNKSK